MDARQLGRLLSRRDFGILSAAALAAPLAGCGSNDAPATSTAPASPSAGPQVIRRRNAAPGEKLNIVFVFGDQERYFSTSPTGLSLPGHERLQRDGVTFENHYTSAIMCTPSRSVLMTGLQTADNRMFDNTDMPWVQSLSPKVPTIGHMLRKAGYYTAYKGKWHLNKDFDSQEPEKLFTKEMEVYGFADYVGVGDIIGHTLGGYEFDQVIAGSAVSWLRRVGRPLSNEGKPWSLFVSLVNPHDIMYFNTDVPGQTVQDSGNLLKRAAPAPDHELYKSTWDLPVAATLREAMDAPGRPRAHSEFLKVWDPKRRSAVTTAARCRRWGRSAGRSIEPICSRSASTGRIREFASRRSRSASTKARRPGNQPSARRCYPGRASAGCQFLLALRTPRTAMRVTTSTQ